MNRARLAMKNGGEKGLSSEEGGLSVPLLWLLSPFVWLLIAYFPCGKVAFQLAYQGSHWIYSTVN